MKKKKKKYIKCSKKAYKAIKKIIKKKKNKKKKLRIYIIGGGCNGFEYQFILDEKKNKDDYILKKKNISIIIDPISLHYLKGGEIKFEENLYGSKFTFLNPNAKTTCSCGSSFST